MKAEFKLATPYRVTVVLKPESAVEAMLLAQWLRFDENMISASVLRGGGERIEECELTASVAN